MPLVHCPECKKEVSSQALSCPQCGHPFRLAARSGYEYRSKLTLAGLPLVHIATGVDAATGRKRVAKGIVAIGDMAVGVLAIGGVAIGGLAVGGLSLGVVACGGLAIGLLVAVGGAALGGYLAIGGFAVGYYVFDGRAFGALCIRNQ